MESYLSDTLRSVFAGVDEVGRGPLAGPVVAAAVQWDYGHSDHLINDSKALTARARERVYEYILEHAVQVEVGIVIPRVIDELNIRRAALLAMRTAVRRLAQQPEIILIDGRDSIPALDCIQVPVIRGDSRIKAIGAASIVAKVVRDRMMERYDTIFPGYHFASHKGYPTAAHKSSLRSLGRCPIHRVSFKGVKEPL
ncbi:ribonuclease HII [bacterium]|nr:ribonuclease HII [bacterium]